MNRALLATVAIPIVVCLLSCKHDKRQADRGAPPPPVAPAKARVCASGGGEVTDKLSASFFARQVGDYCLDPNGETRSYGQDAERVIDRLCTEVVDGECVVYQSYGLERFVVLRYVDGNGSPGSVTVYLSRYTTSANAYGFFTKRVVADSDPLEAAPAPLDAGGAGAIGTGIAYVWRGRYVGELSYTNEEEPPEQLKRSSEHVLPGLARSLGDKLTGDKQPPEAVRALPEQDRIRLGISFDPRNVLAIKDTGPGAVGYYQHEGSRWRVLSIVRSDEASAQDIMRTLEHQPAAKRVDKQLRALRFPVRNDDSSVPQYWVIVRRGERIVGVGDEPYAGAAVQNPPASDQLQRLSALLQGQSALDRAGK
ncbi:MAG: hypothetical protein JW940_22140 [Polyangiaceae bacterium]|nr:hypothetical protein [Polyangiaceae bacterium]